MTNPKPLVVQLVGGLGNQLFGYFAGRYLSQVSGRPVRFDVSQIDRGFTAHGSSIASLIDEAWIERPSALVQATRRLACVVEVKAKKMPHIHRLIGRILPVYTSIVVGLDENLESLWNVNFVRGYFQTFVYATQTHNAVQELGLPNPSSWFSDMRSRAVLEQPVMVHVRRGDYAQLKQEFGLLSADYFKAGIDRARSELQVPSAAVWVFSDDIEDVKREFANLADSGFRFIEVPEDSPDAESMFLMSAGAANVISNSTFSWWSAILGGGRLVVAPAKWFRGKEDPQDLIPESWIRLPSIWKD